MKKLATLLAGILLVGGTVFAADWTYNGNVEWKALELNANSEKSLTVMPDGGQWYKLEVGSQVTEEVKVTLGIDTDDADPDFEASLKVKYTPNEKVEAQVAGKFGEQLATHDDGVAADYSVLGFTEDAGGDTYIKLKNVMADGLTVTLKPFDAGIGIGSEFETDGTQNTSGVEVEMKVSDALAVSGVLNTTEKTVDDEQEDKYGIKGKVVFSAENLTVTGEVSMNTQDDEKITGADAVKMAFGGNAELKLSETITLTGEVISVTLNKAGTILDGDDIAVATGLDESGFGAFAKVAVGIGEMMSMDNTVYASYTMAGEYLYYDGDYSMHKDKYKAAAGKHGGLNVIKAGMDSVWNGVTINNELAMELAGEEIYMDSDNKATDSEMTFCTKVSIEF